MLGYESAEALIKCLSTGSHSLHVDAQRYQEFLRLMNS
jgi:hypothetical protein